MTTINQEREIELVKGDGTDHLLTVLYGESSAKTLRHAIGGSEARMLSDAAEEIIRLRRYERAIQSMADQICSPKTTAEQMVAQILGEPTPKHKACR